MRPIVAIMALVILGAGCTPGELDAPTKHPRLLAAGNLNNLYVATARKIGTEEGFAYWQRDAMGMWHESGQGQGTPVAAAAYREHLLVFFPSGRWGLFGLGRPMVYPSPVPAWTPATLCEDGLAADAFGWNAAGDPVHARYEDTKWSWKPVEAGVGREQLIDPCAVRFRGRLFILWREKVPTLTGPESDFSLRFLYHEKDRWHGPITSRLRVASPVHVAADDSRLICLFLKPLGGETPRWTLATYATADEDWHETGPVAGDIPAGPVAIARSGDEFLLVAMGRTDPVVAPLDVTEAKAGTFSALSVRAEATGPEVDYMSAFALGLLGVALVLVLASARRMRRVVAQATASGQPAAALRNAMLLLRGAALGVDYVVITAIVAPVILVFWPDLPQQLMRSEMVTGEGLLVLVLVRFAAIMVYFSTAEALFGQTLGKRLFGLVVRTESGERVSWWQAVVRNALRAVDEFPAPLYLPGLVLIMLGPKPQRLGDRLAHTLVVPVVPAVPPGPDPE